MKGANKLNGRTEVFNNSRCTERLTYPGAMRNKGVNVVLGLVVVEQTTPGQRHTHRHTQKSNKVKTAQHKTQ